METEANQQALQESIRNGIAVGLSSNRHIFHPYKQPDPVNPPVATTTESKAEDSSYKICDISDGKLTPGMLQYYYLKAKTNSSDFKQMCADYNITPYDDIPTYSHCTIEKTIFDRINRYISHYKLTQKRQLREPTDYSRGDYYDRYTSQHSRDLRRGETYEQQIHDTQSSQHGYWNNIRDRYEEIMKQRTQKPFANVHDNGVSGTQQIRSVQSDHRVDNHRTPDAHRDMLTAQKLDENVLCKWVEINVTVHVQRMIILSDIKNSQRNGYARKTYQLLTMEQRKNLIDYIDTKAKKILKFNN